MTSLSEPLQADLDEDVLTLMEKMGRAEVSQVPVVNEGHLVGMIGRGNVLQHLRLRSELGV